MTSLSVKLPDAENHVMLCPAYCHECEVVLLRGRGHMHALCQGPLCFSSVERQS